MALVKPLKKNEILLLGPSVSLTTIKIDAYLHTAFFRISGPETLTVAPDLEHERTGPSHIVTLKIEQDVRLGPVTTTTLRLIHTQTSQIKLRIDAPRSLNVCTQEKLDTAKMADSDRIA